MVYKLFLIAFLVGICSQIIKYFVNLASGHPNPRNLIMNGGFPSTHTAFTVSLLTTIGYFEGLDSPSFAVAAILTTIIVHDAIRIRVHTGKNGKAINAILKTLSKDHPVLKKIPRQVEITGHNPSEALAGAIFGLFLTLLIISLAS
jgi:acid phosphatase family membrane protein YuiD